MTNQNKTGSEVMLMPTDNARTISLKTGGRQAWEPYADELQKTQDVGRMRELVMILEEAIFNRQQELARY